MKRLFLIVLVCFRFEADAQELFAYSEPASNMPVKSFGLRINNSIMRMAEGGYMYSFAPEIMYGFSPALMMHGELFFNNDPDRSGLNGGMLYGKWRFFSRDSVHSHFRMAAFFRGAYSDLPLQQTAVDLGGRNTGGEIGLIATKLQHRRAYSLSASVVQRVNNSVQKNHHASAPERNAIQFTPSIGQLVLPKEYRNYDQVNMNLMLEMPAQVGMSSGRSYFDIAPSVQFIFKSQMRVDMGYRFPLLQSASRVQDRGFLLRLEYNFFSVFR